MALTFAQTANLTIDRLRVFSNSAHHTIELAKTMSIRAKHVENEAAHKAIDSLVRKEKFIHERLIGFFNRALGLSHNSAFYRDPQATLDELHTEMKHFEISMADIYAGAEYQVSWEYLSQIKRVKVICPHCFINHTRLGGVQDYTLHGTHNQEAQTHGTHIHECQTHGALTHGTQTPGTQTHETHNHETA